jgi:GNAT superfamily N-acetyltransferase
MGRRLEPISLVNLDDLPRSCRDCVFWELDPVSVRQAARNGGTALEKEAWLSRILLDWGTAGVLLYVDDRSAGYALYAPAAYLPRTQAFPTAPVSPDAVVLATGRVLPRYLGLGLGKVIVKRWRRTC